MADPVRLDADPRRLELGELLPVERRVDDPTRGEMLVVRQRPRAAQVADRDEEDRGIAVAAARTGTAFSRLSR